MLLFFCLSLLFQGQARSWLPPVDCPMMAAMAEHSPLQIKEHDCCNDIATYVSTGELCKNSVSAGVPGASLPLLPMHSVAPLRHHTPLVIPHLFILDPTLASIWRPPASC